MTGLGVCELERNMEYEPICTCFCTKIGEKQFGGIILRDKSYE